MHLATKNGSWEPIAMADEENVGFRCGRWGEQGEGGEVELSRPQLYQSFIFSFYKNDVHMRQKSSSAINLQNRSPSELARDILTTRGEQK